jgi:hypothetical protein
MEDPPTAGQQTLNDGGDEGKKDKHPVRLLTLFVVEPGQWAIQVAVLERLVYKASRLYCAPKHVPMVGLLL